jgi:transposase
VRIFQREGLAVSSQTLWDYLERVARLIEPAYTRLQAYVLLQPVIGADETWWRLMGKADKDKGGKRWHAWLASSASAIYICIQESRSAEAAKTLLPGYEGVVMCDGYSAYEALARSNPKFVLAHCWAHVRRAFLEVEPAFPEETKQVLALISELYAVEAACPRGPPGDAMRARLRDERSRAVLERISGWVYATYPRLFPESGLGKAIRYMGGLWKGLVRFLNDPRIPLDNNQTERAIRGPVVGRKNHYGSRSRRGTEVAAMVYSLLESAKLVGVEPKAYLRLALRAALDGEVIPLPHELADRSDASSTAQAIA